MKCNQCGHKNLYKANYCEKCGYKFEEDYKTKAYDKTVYGIINKIEEIYNWLSLDVIFGNTFLKIFLLIIVLFSTGYKIYKDGNDFIIKENESYTVQYNKKQDEYYIVSNEYTINLSLYTPKKTESIIVHEYNIDNVKQNSLSYTLEDPITLLNEQDKYYIIEAIYENSSDNLTVYIYWGE